MLVAAFLAAVLAAEPPLRPVDARSEDLGPLGTSLRVIGTGLAQPTGFERVYRSPDGTGFVRAQGGLFAVFPRSLYAVGPAGATPLVPAGTEFFIGAPPSAPSPVPHASAVRLGARADARLIESPPTTASMPGPGTRDATPSAVTIASDAAFRARRIRELVLRAVEVEETRRARH